MTGRLEMYASDLTEFIGVEANQDSFRVSS